MEEIEKRVEELRKFVNKNLIDGKIDIGLMLQDMENLIKRNKELEEEKNIYYYEWKHLEAEVINDYIPKSKVREKIEENKWASEGYDSDTADYGQSQAIGVYIALIRLLQEGDKNE